MKGQLSDSEGLGGKLEGSDKKDIEAELKKAQDWLDEYSASASVEDFDEQREALQAAVAPITSKIVSFPLFPCLSSFDTDHSSRRSTRKLVEMTLRPVTRTMSCKEGGFEKVNRIDEDRKDSRESGSKCITIVWNFVQRIRECEGFVIERKRKTSTLTWRESKSVSSSQSEYSAVKAFSPST